MLTLDQFDAVCAQQPYQPKGMFYSEVYLFLCRCQRLGVDLIIESGVKFGMSTRLLAASWHGELVAIDKKPVRMDAIFPGVQLLKGDSLQLLPRLLDERPERRVGVLIDGPKGSAALGLKTECLKRQSCRIVGVHDIDAGLGESGHSRDEVFQRVVGRRLDRFVSPEYRSKYPTGPGLSLWEKP
jgi:hypothetical protein